MVGLSETHLCPVRQNLSIAAVRHQLMGELQKEEQHKIYPKPMIPIPYS